MMQHNPRPWQRAHFYQYMLLALMIIVLAFPIFWLVRTALLPAPDLVKLPPVMKFKPSFEALGLVFKEDQFIKQLFNSLVVAVSATAIGVSVGFSAAYGFSRFEYPGKAVLSVAILCLYVMPPIAMILPMYVIFQHIGLAGKLGSLIMTHSIITVPLSTWMLRGFISRLPIELEEAARIDGCNRVEAIIRVVLPLLRPGLVATMVLAFIYSWNDFIYAVILTSGSNTTLPVMIAGYITDKATYWGRIAAAGTLVIAPPFIFGFLVQRHLAEGLSAGAVKS
jgi:multiple sugar transport system permease protein